MDHSLASILKQDDKAVIVLVRGATTIWSDRIVERLRLHFPPGSEHKQAHQRVVVVPAMVRNVYLDFLKSGHVVMLPFPTTSANTVFETISVGTPFVSLGGSASYLLQHYAPGILSAMNMSHECCVAANEDEYVRKILRIGRNESFRRKVSNEFVRGSERLFGKELKERVASEWEVMLRNVLEMER
jgi:predicted O-linked N-acetylglucosamine transferase (SPINDLY family)